MQRCGKPIRLESGRPMAEEPSKHQGLFVWIVRVAFSVVFIMNVMCALSFIVQPGAYAGAYELSGVSGETAVAGMGIAFLMWNCTYPLFIVRPCTQRALGVIILVQQLVGLVGETALLTRLPGTHTLLASSLERFIVFDGVGFVIMIVSFALLAWDLRSR